MQVQVARSLVEQALVAQFLAEQALVAQSLAGLAPKVQRDPMDPLQEKLMAAPILEMTAPTLAMTALTPARTATLRLAAMVSFTAM